MNAKRFSHLILTALAAALVAVPVSQAAAPDRVQIDGRLVPPAQVSAAQVAAGHDRSTRLAQIGGRLVEPSQISAVQSRFAPAIQSSSAAGESSDFGTLGIVLVAALGSALLAASGLVLRYRRRLVVA